MFRREQPNSTGGTFTHVEVSFAGAGRIRSSERLFGKTHRVVFRLEDSQTILSTITPHIKQLIARSKIKTGKDQEPWSP